MSLQRYIEENYPIGSFLVPIININSIIEDFNEYFEDPTSSETEGFKRFVSKVNQELVSKHETVFPEVYFDPMGYHYITLRIDEKEYSESLEISRNLIQRFKKALILAHILEYPEKNKRKKGQQGSDFTLERYIPESNPLFAICDNDKNYRILEEEEFKKIWNLYNEESALKYNSTEESKELDEFTRLLKTREKSNHTSIFSSLIKNDSA